MIFPEEHILNLYFEDTEVQGMPRREKRALIRDAAMNLLYAGDFGDWVENVKVLKGWSQSEAIRFLKKYEDQILDEFARQQGQLV